MHDQRHALARVLSISRVGANREVGVSTRPRGRTQVVGHDLRCAGCDSHKVGPCIASILQTENAGVAGLPPCLAAAKAASASGRLLIPDSEATFTRRPTR